MNVLETEPSYESARGALVIAGFFTFLPGRIMHEVLFSGSSPAELALMALAAFGLLGWIAWAKWPRRRRSGRAYSARAGV